MLHFSRGVTRIADFALYAVCLLFFFFFLVLCKRERGRSHLGIVVSGASLKAENVEHSTCPVCNKNIG